MRRKLVAPGVSAGAPTVLVIVLGVFLAGGQFVAQLLLTSQDQLIWRGIVAEAIQGFATLGVSPVYGEKLTTLLHIPANVLLAAGGLLLAANGVLTAVAIPHVWHVVLATVFTVVGLMIGAISPTVVIPKAVSHRH